MNDHRYQTGKNNLEKMNDNGFKRLKESLDDIAPDLVRFVVEFPYGDIYSMSWFLTFKIPGNCNCSCTYSIR